MGTSIIRSTTKFKKIESLKKLSFCNGTTLPFFREICRQDSALLLSWAVNHTTFLVAGAGHDSGQSNEVFPWGFIRSK